MMRWKFAYFLEMDSEEKDKFLFFIVRSQQIIFKPEKRSDTTVVLRDISKRYRDMKVHIKRAH